LLSKNKLLTRDNLERRKNLDDPTCLFGSEKESVHHIFGCVVPNRVWEVVSQVIGVQTGWDFESVARLWLYNKKFGVANVITSECAGAFGS
jgi:hypothetical protein